MTVWLLLSFFICSNQLCTNMYNVHIKCTIKDVQYVQSIKFHYTFNYHVLRVQMFEKCDSSNCKNESKFYSKI